MDEHTAAQLSALRQSIDNVDAALVHMLRVVLLVLTALAGVGLIVVAVANALPTLKERADWVAPRDHGLGVQSLVDALDFVGTAPDEHGQLRNASFSEYKIPGMLDLPEQIGWDAVDSQQSTGPFGAKGIGESGCFGVASAIAEADGTVLGIFTDGDLRRLIEKGQDLRGLLARDVMHPDPRTLRDDVLAVDDLAFSHGGPPSRC